MKNTNNFLLDDRLNPKFNLNIMVNIIVNPYDKFNLYDKIKVVNKSTDYRNTLQGSGVAVHYLIFSKENIELVQNTQKKVYQYSKNTNRTPK